MKNSGIEWIGEIPNNWEVNLVKNIFDITRGRVIAKTEIEEEFMEGYYPVYSSQTANSGILGYIPSYDFAIDSLTWTTDGAKAGTVFLRKGKYSITNVCGILTLKTSEYSLNYLYYAVGFSAYNSRRADINGYKIMSNEMAAISIPVPDKIEQQKIADILDEKCGKIDKLIENEQKQIEKMKEYKQSVITSAVTEGLDKSSSMKDSGIDWIGEIPESWQLRKLNYCFDLIGSGTTPKSDNEEFYGEEIAWLQSGDINGGYVYKTEKMIVGKAIETYSVLKIYQAPFLAVAMYGASVGNCSIVKLDAATNQACCVMSKSKGYLKYLFYCILAGKIALIDLAKGGTQPNISQEIIRNFRVPFPLTNEQKEIADYLDEKCGKIDEVISIKQRKIEKLQEYKKSLIYEYVTGKKEVG